MQRAVAASIVLTLLAAGQANDLSQGAKLLREGRPDEARKVLERAAKAPDASPECHLALAVAYFRLDARKKALAACDRALSAGAAPDGLRAEALNLKGAILTSEGKRGSDKLQQAQEFLGAAVSLAPANSTYRYNMAFALLKDERDEQAAEHLETYLRVAPQGPLAKRVKAFLENPKRARGDFLDFNLITSEGQVIQSYDLLGKVVVIDFWATWCGPCISAIPSLRALSRRYPADKFALISVSTDSNMIAWRSMIAEKQMDWPQVHSPALATAQGISAIPAYLVVDPNGMVIQRPSGRSELDIRKIESLLK